MTLAPRHHRAALKHILIAGMLVALLVVGGALGLLGYAAQSMDRLALQTERRLVERSLIGARESLIEGVTSATVWDATAWLLTQPRVDPAEIQVNFGDWYADYMNHEVTLVYDVEGRLIQASRDSRSVATEQEAAFADAVAPLVDEVRAASRAQRRGPRRFGFDSVETATGVVSAYGQIYFVVASTVVSETDQVAQPAVDPVVVSGKNFSLYLRRLERDMPIAGAVYSAVPAEASGPSMPLIDPRGQTIGSVRWTPSRPGVGILRSSAPLIALLLLALTASGVVLLLRVSALMGKLEQNERELTEARDRAEKASAAKSQFLANMSHELRTPLNGVVALADLLRSRQTDPEDREMAGLIVSSGQLLERVVNDVLDVSKIEAGKRELESVPFDLELVLSRTAQLHGASAAAKGITLACRIRPDAAGAWRGDPGRVAQIVSNLLGNAVKFTSEGAVTLTARRLGDRLQLTVRDTGPGFTREVGARLFQRFEQADVSMTRRHGGTGLGLSICASLAGLMGGVIRARGAPGKGAVFSVVLPLEPLPGVTLPTPAHVLADRAAAAPPPVAIAGSKPEPESAAPESVAPLGPRVLLAEDHPTNQRVVSLILGAINADLTIVGDGAQAVAEAEASRFDVILMDVQMPVMDGLTATRRIREYERAFGLPRTPIVSLTAHALAEHAASSLAAGSDLHLAKPIRPDALLKVMEQVLSGTAPDAAENVA